MTVADLLAAQPAVNDRGNSVYRGFDGSAERSRYVYDVELSDWAQYDTEQDAHYFGVWVNKKDMMILTYAEGDVTLVTCPDIQAYNAEIEYMNSFYGEGFICKAYDLSGESTVCRQDRKDFLMV